MERGLREQLLQVGGDGMNELIVGAFSDSGGSKVSLGELTNRIDAMGCAHESSPCTAPR